MMYFIRTIYVTKRCIHYAWSRQQLFRAVLAHGLCASEIAPWLFDVPGWRWVLVGDKKDRIYRNYYNANLWRQVQKEPEFREGYAFIFKWVE